MSIRLIISLSFILSATLTQGSQSYPPKISSDSVHTYKSVEGHDLKIWVFNPTTTPEKNAPAILFFFGGGWNSGSPTHFVKYCERLSERGMVGIVADYRVKSRQGVQAKTCVEDALDALRYITKNATTLEIDPMRIGVGGGSAGGHLAASLGTIHASDPAAPKVMALFNPATLLAPIPSNLLDTPLPTLQGLEQINAVIQAKEGQLRDRIGLEPVELSPFHHVASNSPPAIIFHGTNDKAVPYESAKLFASNLGKNGVFVDLKTYEGAGHGFFNREPYFSQTAEELEAFLIGLGWLE